MLTLVSNLTARGVSYQKNGSSLFEKLSFKLKAGDILHIRGQNGSGKTTLLKIIAGMTTPTCGKIYWQNVEINDSENYKKELCYIGHKTGVKANLTVYENLKLMSCLRSGCSKNFFEVLAKLKLHHLMNDTVHTLSAGQKQKLALARLLIYSPVLWLLDEPFTALDLTAIKYLKTLMIDHLQTGGIIIFTSHQEIVFNNIDVLSLNLSEQ